MKAEPRTLLIVGTESDNPFANDIAASCQQQADIADAISLKTFANGEFCPRFISDERDLEHIGTRLAGATLVLVTTGSSQLTRNELAWRNLLVARAAKDNGADKVLLVEPDLFFSAQDRGPRPEHAGIDLERPIADYKKFDGQPFSSKLYAEALALSGVDAVITVHNHSDSVLEILRQKMPEGVVNLNPAEVFADYIRHSDVVPALHSGDGLLVCAPDKGARQFASDVHDKLASPRADLLFMDKQRLGERNVSIVVDAESPSPAQAVAGRDVVILDDMVRTGGTIMECCRLLKEAGAGRLVFLVTHFYASAEVRENLHNPVLDEIVTTNTIPCILNRDTQGRLRRKMTVLKLEGWISRYVLEFLWLPVDHMTGRLYAVDMSSKNPRWRAVGEANSVGS